ncbi:MAG: GerMN domain-containing protein [Muribaculaceae bacterium]|nr:GerMN domain-containing protein [Roseburia sp.]MCM1431135.1 GerMN domain-containing protein [Muribaculaceae bacterium]MCM1492558.1 GerMN domain-containing protein [Muribaculaceae bacterium]
MGTKMRILLTGIFALLLAGCGSDNEDGEYVVYYLNADTTKVVGQDITLTHTQGSGMVDELLAALSTQPEDSALRQTIPPSVRVLGYHMMSYQITVDFSGEYYELTPIEEVLTRAAVAKTLFQVGDYTYVAFTVESEPLVNSQGMPVGSMNADSFVENPGQQINSSQQTTLALYFASEDGSRLVKETRVVHYSSNISLEKLVMEQLMEGPKKSGSLATIPTGTKLINVSVVDGICYVSLDEVFLNQNPEITEQVVLYSIVDSMTELATVEKVQISINGDTSGKCRYSYELSTLYEADESIVGEEVESTE